MFVSIAKTPSLFLQTTSQFSSSYYHVLFQQGQENYILQVFLLQYSLEDI